MTPYKTFTLTNTGIYYMCICAKSIDTDPDPDADFNAEFLDMYDAHMSRPFSSWKEIAGMLMEDQTATLVFNTESGYTAFSMMYPEHNMVFNIASGLQYG